MGTANAVQRHHRLADMTPAQARVCCPNSAAEKLIDGAILDRPAAFHFTGSYAFR
jgi:hypothetical protein